MLSAVILQAPLPAAPRLAPVVKPAAPAPPADPEPLKEGTAYYDSLAAEVAEEEVVAEKHLMSMVNKLMRKDKDNTFKVEPQKGALSSRIVRDFSTWSYVSGILDSEILSVCVCYCTFHSVPES